MIYPSVFILNLFIRGRVNLRWSNEGVIIKGQGPNRRSRSGTVGQKNGKISDEVGFRLRILIEKMNLFCHHIN
jgi:hypothetical protein